MADIKVGLSWRTPTLKSVKKIFFGTKTESKYIACFQKQTYKTSGRSKVGLKRAKGANSNTRSYGVFVVKIWF